MAVATYLYTRSKTGAGATIVDGLTAMVLVIDGAVDTTQAARFARAVTVANAKGFAVPAGYFDTEKQLAAFGTGVTTEDFKAAGDGAIFGRYETVEVINGVETDQPVQD